MLWSCTKLLSTGFLLMVFRLMVNKFQLFDTQGVKRAPKQSRFAHFRGQRANLRVKFQVGFSLQKVLRTATAKPILSLAGRLSVERPVFEVTTGLGYSNLAKVRFEIWGWSWVARELARPLWRALLEVWASPPEIWVFFQILIFSYFYYNSGFLTVLRSIFSINPI